MLVRKILLGAVLILAASCGKDEGQATQPKVTDEASAQAYFKQFQFKQPIENLGPATYVQSKVIKGPNLNETGDQAVYFKVNLYLLENLTYVLEYIQVEDRDPNDDKTFGKATGQIVEGKWHFEGKTLKLDNAGTIEAIKVENKDAIRLDTDVAIAVANLKPFSAGGSGLSLLPVTSVLRFEFKGPEDLKNHLPNGEEEDLAKY